MNFGQLDLAIGHFFFRLMFLDRIQTARLELSPGVKMNLQLKCIISTLVVGLDAWLHCKSLSSVEIIFSTDSGVMYEGSTHKWYPCQMS